MQIRNLIVPTVAAIAVALAFRPPAAEITFHPAEGRTLTKTFTGALGLDLELDRSLMGWIGRVRAKTRAGVQAPTEIVALSTLLHEQRLIKDGAEIKLMRNHTDHAHQQNHQNQHAGQPGHQQQPQSLQPVAAYGPVGKRLLRIALALQFEARLHVARNVVRFHGLRGKFRIGSMNTVNVSRATG